MNKIRDELMKEILFDGHGCLTGDCPHEEFRKCFEQIAKDAWDAAENHFKSAAPEFSLENLERYLASDYDHSNQSIARFQNDQDKAYLGARDEKIRELFGVIQDNNIEISSLKSDRIEFDAEIARLKAMVDKLESLNKELSQSVRDLLNISSCYDDCASLYSEEEKCNCGAENTKRECEQTLAEVAAMKEGKV